MTEVSAPWAGTVTGDASLAPYSAEEWAAIWRDFIRGSKADSGPLLGSGVSPDAGLTVQATGPASASIQVTAGSALVRGKWYNTSATVVLPITANSSGNPRVDTVILRASYAAQTIRLVVLPGSPAATPVPPALTQTEGVTWEIPLADVAVANGFATITDANITPRMNWANIADGVYLVDILNNSGAALETGEVVVWDLTADRAVTTSGVLGNGNVAGVWVGRTAAGGYGRVLVRGVGKVKVTGAVATRGLVLVQSTTAKSAIAQSTVATASKRNSIGTSLQTTAGSGLCWANVNVGAQRTGAIVINTSLQSGSVTGAWAQGHVSHTVTITPHTDSVRVTVQFAARLANADTAYFDIYSVSLAARAGTANEGLNHLTTAAASNDIPVEISAVFTGLTPGVAQEFQLYLKTGGAAAVSAWWPVRFTAEEI